MNKQQTSEERLWDYIDGISSPQEKTVIEQLIQTDVDWKSKYRELLEVQQLLQSSELEAPSMRFTKNVMEEIAKLHIAPATRNYINKRIIWGIGAFFITIIVGFLIYGIGQIDWTAQGDSKLPVDLSNVDFRKVDYSKMFSNNLVNAFMMLNVILGLFLLDRYLANKRKKFHEET
ncbi:MAG TPA: hypothetical protein VFD56_13460 [Chitinophagaceae bacterium]|nr:hypothetical protein [Chitinophagaceae bacterium]